MKNLLYIFWFLPLCGLTQQRKTPSTIHLRQAGATTAPFLPSMRTVKKVGDTSIFLNKPTPDSFIFYRAIVVDDVSNGFTEEQNRKNSLHFIVFKSDSNKYIFDTDMDGNFKDEAIYIRNSKSDFITIKNVSFSLGNQTTRQTIFLKPSISELTINGQLRRNLGVAVQPLYRTGNFSLNKGGMFRVAAFNMFEDRYTRTNTHVMIVPEEKGFPDAKVLPVFYKIGDTIYLAGRKILLIDINNQGDSIAYTDLGKAGQNIGIDEGKIILPVSFRNIYSGEKQTLGTNGKYTLIDFWGTWCTPCIELMPEIEKLVEQYKLQWVQIAYDDSIEKVKKFQAKKDIVAINGFDDANNSTICSQLKIRNFPTIILLDSNGKILQRVVGKDEFKKLKLHLDKLNK